VDRVRTAEGVPLATTMNVRVTDNVAPTFDGVTATTTSLSLLFSEPVLCLSLHTNDFTVENVTTGQPVSITGYTCVGATARPVAQVAGVVRVSDHLRVTVVGAIYDQSEDNTVLVGSVKSSFAG
jgi:hypothetical protein